MKQIIYITGLVFMSMNVIAQQEHNIQIQNLTLIQTGNILQIDWETNKVAVENYWKVQGSVDGESFSTIGIVMGGNLKGTKKAYSFKQTFKKIKTGTKYFRVLHMENDDMAIVSNTVVLKK